MGKFLYSTVIFIALWVYVICTHIYILFVTMQVYMFTYVCSHVCIYTQYIYKHIFTPTHKHNSISNEVTTPSLKFCILFSSNVIYTYSLYKCLLLLIYWFLYVFLCIYICAYTWIPQRHNDNFNCFWELHYQGGWCFALDKLQGLWNAGSKILKSIRIEHILESWIVSTLLYLIKCAWVYM